MKRKLLLSVKKVSILFVMATLSLTGCRTSKDTLITRRVNRAEQTLGLSITKKDYMPLFLVASDWIGVPYLAGGTTMRGVDCSGLACTLYDDLFHTRLSRTAEDMYDNDCRKIRRTSNLENGDLVFFKTEGSRKINHVGIYLKDNLFIHATTSNGVRIDNLKDEYYSKCFYRGGRPE